MARGSILIVDADVELAKLIGAFLNSQGFRVNSTGRVRDAILKLSLQKYHVILLDPDLKSSGGNDKGEDVLIGARDPGGMNSKTPFIIMTRSVQYSLPNHTLSQLKAILLKPFEFEDLLGAVKLSMQTQSTQPVGKTAD